MSGDKAAVTRFMEIARQEADPSARRRPRSGRLEIAARHMREADPLVLPSLLDSFRNNSGEAVGLAMVKAMGTVESSLGTVGSQRVEQLVSKYPAAVKQAAAPLGRSRSRGGRCACR